MVAMKGRVYGGPDMEQQLDRLLRRVEVEHAVGMARSTLYREVAEGRFPKPIKAGVLHNRWWASDIRAYLDSLKDETA